MDAGLVGEFVEGCVPDWVAAFEDPGVLPGLLAEFGAAGVSDALFPTKGSVAAGDFGEILGCLLLEERDGAHFAPRKWRWKEGPDKPAPFTDVVVFGYADGRPSYAVIAEVKVRSTDASSGQFAAAVEGATKDRDGRFSETLAWLKRKYLRDGDHVRRAQVGMFVSAGSTSYDCHHVALVVADTSLIPPTPDAGGGFPGLVRIVVAVPDLRTTYRAHYDRLRQFLVSEEAAIGGDK